MASRMSIARQVSDVLHLTEADFRRQIVGKDGLAGMYGWLHVGFRPAQTEHGWRTPVTGELGKGWPDLVLIRPRDRRLLFVELKTSHGLVSPDQAWVHEQLAAAGYPVNVWRPADLDSGVIAAVLR